MSLKTTDGLSISEKFCSTILKDIKGNLVQKTKFSGGTPPKTGVKIIGLHIIVNELV